MRQADGADFLVLGNGAAAVAAAHRLRQRMGATAKQRLLLCAPEAEGHYYRAALTNYLQGELGDHELWADVDRSPLPRRYAAATALDLNARQVTLSDGSRLGYGVLLIACGAAARLPGDGFESLAGFHCLRTLDDAHGIIAALSGRRVERAVVLGGGILGLEVAEALHKRGVRKLTVLHRGERLLDRVVDGVSSELIRAAMERDGVQVALNAKVAGPLVKGGRIAGVALADGHELPADLVVACVGTAPNTAWLKDSGVTLNRAGLIEVDRSMRVKGCSGVYAAGDVAAVDESDQPVPNPGGLWQPARYQGRVAGNNMDGNVPAEEYRPGLLLNATRAWGFSVDSAGLHPSQSAEQVIFRGEKDGRHIHKCAVLREGRLAGFVLLGDRREARALATLLDLRAGPDGGPPRFDGPELPESVCQRLFDPQFDLGAWVAAQAFAAGGRRWSRRDRLGEIAGQTPSEQSAASAQATTAVLGMTDLLLSAKPARAQRPLRLQVYEPGREPVTVQRQEGPVWIGNHAKAELGAEANLPREVAVCLAPSGLTWFASCDRLSDLVRLNGAVLDQATVLRPNDVLTVGPWRAVLWPREAGDSASATPAATRRAWLIGIDRVALPRAGVLRIGALAGENDLVLDHSGPPFHAQIAAQEGRYVVRRMSAGAEVKVDGVPAEHPVELRHGQRIDFGGSVWRFEWEETEPARAGAEETGRIVGYLCAQNGPQAGQALSLRARNGVARIGRGAECELCLPDAVASRVHAVAEQAGAMLTLRDHASSNGTEVGGRWLEGDERVTLTEGVEIRIGLYLYRYSREAPLGKRVAESAHHGTMMAVGHTRVMAGRASAANAAPAPRLTGVALKPIANDIFPEGTLPRGEFHGPGVFELGRGSRPTDESVTTRLAIDGHTISRAHLAIVVGEDMAQVRDLGSRHGTQLNDRPVGAEPVRLNDGDRLVLGGIVAYEVSLLGISTAAGAGASEVKSRRRAPAVFWLNTERALETDLPAIVSEELDACIGCHACMRACPLPDSDTVSIAALNAAATAGAAPAGLAQRFVESCTQCRACVPVCPVGIERSRIVLWNKLKLEVDGNHEPSLQVGLEGHSLRLGQTLAQVAQRLEGHAVLGALGVRDRIELLAGAQFRRLSDRETLLAAGQFVSTFWIVLEGEVTWAVVGPGGDLLPSVYLKAGDPVAAREYLADEQTRNAALAHGETVVLGLPRAVAKRHAERSTAFRAALLALAQDPDVIERLPLLAGLPARDKVRLHDEGRWLYAEAGQMLRSPDAGFSHAMVVRGFVAEQAQETRHADPKMRVADYHRAGALLHLPQRGTPSRFRVQAACELLLLPAEIAAKLGAARGEAGSEAGGCRPPGAAMPPGKRIMAIDLRLCVDCDNCVDACGRRHGHARIDRRNQGRQLGAYHVPNACYHCEDPRCLICEVGGIERTDSGEIRIVEDHCIGCGACAERCPFDNIRMVERRPQVRTSPFTPLLRLIGLARQETAPSSAGPRLASKCDLCSGYDDGPACVRACPTGAAARADLASLPGVQS